MIYAVLGSLSLVMLVASTGYSLYDIISSGAYKNFTLLDWIWNIAYLLLSLNLIFDLFGGFAKALMTVAGLLGRLLMKIPLLGPLVEYVRSFFFLVKTFGRYAFEILFKKGGYLWKFGELVSSIGRIVVKHPWLMAGLIFSSTMFDGIVKRVFQLWGDLSLRAATLVYERVGEIMSDKHYGDPITEAVGIIDGSRSQLPECFTAIWGAVGASECIGLIITTFQYLFLLSALVKGYKVFGK